MIYNKYLIREGDHFHEENFPLVSAELDAVAAAISVPDGNYAAAIFIGFVRDHHLKLEWIHKYPELSSILTSKSVKTSCMEALFDSCAANKVFQEEFESYIAFRLAPSTIAF